MKIDEVNSSPYEDEFTHEGMKFFIPAKSYYNEVERVYFDAQKFDERFAFCSLRYDIIPKIVELPYVFIQDSSFEALEKAEEREAQLREDWKDKYLRCCVDAINYDPWIVLIDRLKKLFCIWAKLGVADEELVELPPIEMTDMSDETCSKCGKKKNECECNIMKLCTKCYPLDLYGMSKRQNMGKLVEDKNASIYGMFTATGYLYDQSNHPMSFAEIAKEVHSAVYAMKTDEDVPIEMFSVVTQYSMAVLSVTYEMLQSCAQFKIGGSTVSSFSADGWENFLREYSIGLTNEKNMNSMKFSNEFKVGIADGYAYIPTGYTICFEYNPVTYEFTIKGADSMKTAMLLSLATCTEDEYMMMWRPLANACAPLSDDMKKFIAYPFMPSAKSIIQGEDAKEEVMEETDEKFIYIPDPSDAYLVSMPSLKETFNVRFSIYIKKPVLCHYPKSKNPRCRTRDTEGFCGLRELFEKPLIVCPYNFDLEKEILKRETRKKRIKMKTISQNLKDDTQFIKESACNVTKNLQRIDEIKNAAMAETIDFFNEKQALFKMVGKDKTNEGNQGSVLCESVLSQTQKSVMADYDQVFNQTINSIGLVGDESFDKTKEEFAGLLEDFTTINNSLKKSMKEIASSLPIFMICNKKFNDYLTEQNEPKSFDACLVELMKEEFMKDINESVKARVGNNAIMENVKKIEGLPDNVKNELIESIKNNDFDKMKSLIKNNKALQELTKDGKTDDEKVMSLIKKMGECSSDKSSLAKGVEKESFSKLGNSCASFMKTLKEKFGSGLKTLTKGLKFIADCAKCAKKMTSAISSGITSGIDKTVKETIYPLFGLSAPAEDEGKKKSGKDTLSSMSSMDDKVAAAKKTIKTSLGNLADTAKEKAAKAACSSIKSCIMSCIGPYLSSASIGIAAMCGVSGALSSSGSTKTGALASVTQMISGLLNTAMEKTGLKTILKSVLDGIISSAKKLGMTVGSGVEGATKIFENLAKNVGDEVSKKMNEALNGETAKKLESMKETVKKSPELNEMVSSVAKKKNEDTKNAVMGFCNGSSSFNIEEQGNDATKKTVENDSAGADAVVQVHKFIKDNTKLYQRLTGKFITFDSTN